MQRQRWTFRFRFTSYLIMPRINTPAFCAAPLSLALLMLPVQARCLFVDGLFRNSIIRGMSFMQRQRERERLLFQNSAHFLPISIIPLCMKMMKLISRFIKLKFFNARQKGQIALSWCNTSCFLSSPRCNHRFVPFKLLLLQLFFTPETLVSFLFFPIIAKLPSDIGQRIVTLTIEPCRQRGVIPARFREIVQACITTKSCATAIIREGVETKTGADVLGIILENKRSRQTKRGKKERHGSPVRFHFSRSHSSRESNEPRSSELASSQWQQGTRARAAF